MSAESSSRRPSGPRSFPSHGRLSLLLPLGVALVLIAGCESSELARLREENENLKQALLELEERLDGPAVTVPPFTVGLALSDPGGREGRTLELLRESLDAAASQSGRGFRIRPITGEHELARLRGGLIQNHLLEGAIPLEVTDLAIQLREDQQQLLIAEQALPEEGLERERLEEGRVRITHPGPLRVMAGTGARGELVLPYEVDGEPGALPLGITEADLFATSEEPRFIRQGDLELSYRIDLAPLRAYEISDFAGDMGRFLRHMRYSKSAGQLNRYQTIRDSTYLFGYGPFPTGLVQRLETPTYIERVEVLALAPEVVEQLEPGMNESRLLEVIAAVESPWESCQLANLDGEIKSWERPLQIQVPFLSRQTAPGKGLVFYTRYDPDGPVLLGDYTLKGK